MDNPFQAISRRGFIGGAAACGMSSFAAAAGNFRSGRPNLRVGVLSDIHIRIDGATGRKVDYSDDATFIHALEWFRDQGVDAVMITGDITDYGKISEMQLVADDWFRVFPGDRAPDGRKVERLFVMGNHDWDYFPSDAAGNLRRYGAAEAADIPKNLICGDPDGVWRRIWHEPLERVFMKNVKGYVFAGAHWMGGKGPGRYSATGPFLEKHRRDIDPSRPFFYMQHPHPKDTVCPWTRFHDGGASTGILSTFPNAVALTGHSHYSLTDERCIWQGAFTSVNAGCLRFTEPPLDSRPPLGWENTRAAHNQKLNDPGKMMPLMWADWTGRQGMLMDVYDDRIVFVRRDFLHDLSLGDDWVVPLGAGASKPYKFAPRAERSLAPEFPAGARLKVRKIRAKSRGVDGRGGGAPETDAFEVTVPQADAVSTARPFEYELAAVDEGGKRTELTPLLDAGYAHSPKNAGRQVPLKCPVAFDRLPKSGRFRFEAVPVGNWGKKGGKIVSEEFSVSGAEV
jgi:hypothetical protein